MPYIRFLHIRDFNKTKRRFGGGSLEPDSDGISVVELDCATERSGNPCDHGRNIYQHITSDPVLYIILSDEELAARGILQHAPKTDEPPDDCHWLVTGANSEESKTFIENLTKTNPGRVQICTSDGESRSIDVDRLVEWKAEVDRQDQALQERKKMEKMARESES